MGNNPKDLKSVTEHRQCESACTGLALYDYRVYLKQRELPFVECGPYFLIGEQKTTESWLIHISVVRQQMKYVMEPLLEYLSAANLPFAIPLNYDQHSRILDGRAGPGHVGKVISVAVPDESGAVELEQQLLELCHAFIGPEIPGAAHISPCLAISFGRLAEHNDFHVSRNYSSLYGYLANKDLFEKITRSKLRWPFRSGLVRKGFNRLLNKQYLPVQSLKSDAKGNVLKCIKINRFYDMQVCVLKQGRRYQCYDDQGRDIRNRLMWQSGVHRLLEDKGILPKAIEYFEYSGDGYFAMEFIDGLSLSDTIAGLHDVQMWPAFPGAVKRRIVDILLKIVGVLEILHCCGFVHRDVAPGNFMVTASGAVMATDIELCYDVNKNEPAPAYTLGTPGYMSSRQLRREQPLFEDDIYSLGALFIKVFTGISPHRLVIDVRGDLPAVLRFLTGSDLISKLICRCLCEDAASAPDLRWIKKSLEVYDAVLLSEPSPVISEIRKEDIDQILQRRICALLHYGISGKAAASILNGHAGPSIGADAGCAGLYNGPAGVLALYSLARYAGLLPVGDETFSQVLNKIEISTDCYFAQPPGLWKGCYGTAITMDHLLEAEGTERGIYRLHTLKQLISRPSCQLSLAQGIAGQGLALLYFYTRKRLNDSDARLSEIVSCLTCSQEEDGSWLLQQPAEVPTPKLKLCGFAHGTGGILYFLLQHYAVFGEQTVKQTIQQGLNWLVLQNSHRIDQTRNVKPGSGITGPWLEYGFSGIALVFIKAYEVLQEPEYREIATALLRKHPPLIAGNHFSQGNGLAGLGEIYLEAFRIFSDDEWQERAAHIALLLRYTYINLTDDSAQWQAYPQDTCCDDFMEGDTGILHFLLRFRYPDRITFPFSLN